MKKIQEIYQAVRFYGETKQGVNPPAKFFTTLNRIETEDLELAKKILGKDLESGLLTYASIYFQRTVEMAYIFVEVFVNDEYDNWNPSSDAPRVIDLGGDPGAVSVQYWKKRRPNAKVTVVEANPATAITMQDNLSNKNFEDIEVINAAISGVEGSAILNLHRPGTGWHTQDFVGNGGGERHYRVEVPRILLSSLISSDEKIDLIKIDIEGAESEAIRDLELSGKLKQVRQIIMEFHHDKILFPENDLMSMINSLQENGFLISDLHITEPTGLRKKSKISMSELLETYQQTKAFITFSATRQ